MNTLKITVRLSARDARSSDFQEERILEIRDIPGEMSQETVLQKVGDFIVPFKTIGWNTLEQENPITSAAQAMGSKGGKKSKRKLTSEEARAMALKGVEARKRKKEGMK